MSTRVPLLHRGEIVRIRGERWRISGQIAHGAVAIIETTGCDASNRQNHARFLLPVERFHRLNPSPEPRVVRPARWRHVAGAALATAEPTWASLRTATLSDFTVMPFQLEPALAMTRGDACRFLIADGVGAGKTVEAGLMVAETLHRRPDGAAMIICPSGLREQWRDELRTRFGLDAQVFDAAALARAAAGLPMDVNPWTTTRLVITSIDFVKRPEVLRSLESLIWDITVFDEAHNLAGRSDRAAAASLLAGRSRVLILLTATPHSGNDKAFARLCALGSLNDAEPLAVFRRTRAPEIPRPKRDVLLRVRLTPAEAAMHDALMTYARLLWSSPAGDTLSGTRLLASVLTRRASSSANALARSIERRLSLMTAAAVPSDLQQALPFHDAPVSDDAPDALLAVRGLADAAGERRRLESLLRLARAAACGESKVSVIRRFLSRIAEPVIVFTEYRDTLEHLASALNDVETAQLHGGLTGRERASAIHRFTNGEVRLLLATDAGSEGLNLHHRCRLVIDLELPWMPLRLEQRAGRVDRIGQTRRVHAVHLVAARTCEESTLARLLQRHRHMQNVVDLVSRLPGEQQIADAVFDGRPLPDLNAGVPALPGGIVTPDLRREAGDEAIRILDARARSATNRPSDDGRPAMTRLRRRQSNSGPESFWLFRLALTTRRGHILWEPFVSIHAALARVPLDRSAAVTRLVLRDHPALRQLLSPACDETLASMHLSLRRAVRRWIGREQSLRDNLRRRHARLSAALVQRALFDRRDERAAASQTELLDKALSRSANRLTELAGCEDPGIDSCDLVFGLIRE